MPCRQKLKLNAAAVQIPIGLESDMKGVVDLIRKQAYYFNGPQGYALRAFWRGGEG